MVVNEWRMKTPHLPRLINRHKLTPVLVDTIFVGLGYAEHIPPLNTLFFQLEGCSVVWKKMFNGIVVCDGGFFFPSE